MIPISYNWQNKCLESWISHDCHGIAHVVTGAGKTHLALMAIEYLQKSLKIPLNTIIIVPTCALMDQWVRELKNTFGNSCTIARVGGGSHGDFKSDFQIMVVNSARYILPQRRTALLADNHAVFLICDECHHYGSPENRKIFSGIALDAEHYYTLGLSATPHSTWFETDIEPNLGKIIYHYIHEEALNDKIIAPFIIEQISVSFTGEELKKYTELSYEISLKMAKFLFSHKNMRNLPPHEFFSMLHRLKDSDDKMADELLNLLILRKELVLLADSRIICVQKLVEQLPDDGKILVFCERISQADTIYSSLEGKFKYSIGKYHSERSPEQNRSDMQKFKSGECRIMVACKSLDEGVDVPEADIAIILSGSSMERQHIQRLGRILRRSIDNDKLGALYYLYIKQSAEDECFLPIWGDDKSVINLNYSTFDGFSCTQYENISLAVLNNLKKVGASCQQYQEAKNCLLEGLILTDWKRSQYYCKKKEEQAKSSGNTHKENYWRCMSWMSKYDKKHLDECSNNRISD